MSSTDRFIAAALNLRAALEENYRAEPLRRCVHALWLLTCDIQTRASRGNGLAS